MNSFGNLTTDIVHMESDEKTLSELIDEAMPILAKFVVPIYENDNRGRPSLHGSGFFVKSDGHHFLVSAAHVLETHQRKPLFYYIDPSTKRELSGQLLLNHWEDDREQDPADLGILKLGGGGLPPYPQVDKFAIDISYLRPGFLPRSGKRYMIIGFPASKSQVNPMAYEVAVTAYGYHTDSLEEADYCKHGLAPETHVVLPLDLKVGFDSGGQHRNFPKPQGMSGSPIFVLYHEDGQYDGPELPIVAVGTKYRKKEHLLIATDIAEIIRMIKGSV